MQRGRARGRLAEWLGDCKLHAACCMLHAALLQAARCKLQARRSCSGRRAVRPTVCAGGAVDAELRYVRTYYTNAIHDDNTYIYVPSVYPN